MTTECTTLKNGMRILTDTVTDVDSIAMGVWCAVGTRDEGGDENGVAHMVEHMMFQGTATRSAAQIAEEIEGAGGQMNAWTSRDMTAYHFHLLKDDAALGVDMLADMLQHASLPEENIERERGVILQEIGMSIDTPDDLVFDLYQSTAYPQQTFGAPILGTADTVAAMTRDQLHNYVQRFYTPKNLVLSASGHIRHDDFVKMAEAAFTDLPPDRPRTPAPARYQGGTTRMDKEMEQAHIVLGYPSITRHDPRYYSAVALAMILGGGMSSRLFQEIREKRGLVYSVFAMHAAHDDTGQIMFYAGTGPDLLAELMPVLRGELDRIAGETVDEVELHRARTQLRANLLMARESMMTRAGQQARHQIHFDKTLNVAELLDRIDAVSAATIRDLAATLFAAPPTLAALGPGVEGADFL